MNAEGRLEALGALTVVRLATQPIVDPTEPMTEDDAGDEFGRYRHTRQV
jgi:hypothetical protein